MILDLYIYPHPVLLQVAEPVETFDDDLKKLVDDMADTMYEGNGVGLAAPQIGLSKRLFVVDTSAPEEPSTLKAYVNPKIIVKDQPIVWNEGCLSLPGLYRDVQTYGHVIVEAQYVEGNWFREEAKELRCKSLLRGNIVQRKWRRTRRLGAVESPHRFTLVASHFIRLHWWCLRILSLSRL